MEAARRERTGERTQWLIPCDDMCEGQDQVSVHRAPAIGFVSFCSHACGKGIPQCSKKALALVTCSALGRDVFLPCFSGAMLTDCSKLRPMTLHVLAPHRRAPW